MRWIVGDIQNAIDQNKTPESYFSGFLHELGIRQKFMAKISVFS